MVSPALLEAASQVVAVLQLSQTLSVLVHSQPRDWVVKETLLRKDSLVYFDFVKQSSHNMILFIRFIQKFMYELRERQ